MEVVFVLNVWMLNFFSLYYLSKKFCLFTTGLWRQMVKPLIGYGVQKLGRNISNLPILKRSVDLNIWFLEALWYVRNMFGYGYIVT